MARRGESIYHRKDGLWEARYVKGIEPTGKKKYGSVYGHSYREAKEKRQDVLDHILLFQTTSIIRNITVGDLAKEWLQINSGRLKPSSLQRYRGFLKNHIEPCLGSARVIYLTTVMIHSFAQNRLTVGLAPQSVNAVLVMLHSILKYGHRQYGLPLPEIIYLAAEKKEMRVLTAEEQTKLANYLLQDIDSCKLGVLTALYTGLRIGELCALRWEDIGEDCIRVKRTVQRLKKEDNSGTELFVGAPKTASSIRVIPLPSFLKELIDCCRGERQENTNFLADRSTGIVEPRVMQYRFQKYLKEAGVTKANFHALRHTFATRCVECGFEVKSLSEILGHSNVQTTLNKYVHSSFELKQSNMERLEAYFVK